MIFIKLICHVYAALLMMFYRVAYRCGGGVK